MIDKVTGASPNPNNRNESGNNLHLITDDHRDFYYRDFSSHGIKVDRGSPFLAKVGQFQHLLSKLGPDFNSRGYEHLNAPEKVKAAKNIGIELDPDTLAIVSFDPEVEGVSPSAAWVKAVADYAQQNSSGTGLSSAALARLASQDPRDDEMRKIFEELKKFIPAEYCNELDDALKHGREETLGKVFQEILEWIQQTLTPENAEKMGADQIKELQKNAEKIQELFQKLSKTLVSSSNIETLTSSPSSSRPQLEPLTVKGVLKRTYSDASGFTKSGILILTILIPVLYLFIAKLQNIQQAIQEKDTKQKLELDAERARSKSLQDQIDKNRKD